MTGPSLSVVIKDRPVLSVSVSFPSQSTELQGRTIGLPYESGTATGVGVLVLVERTEGREADGGPAPRASRPSVSHIYFPSRQTH